MNKSIRGWAASALVAMAALGAAALAGCAGGVASGAASDSQASDRSGITVFGTVDASVSHTRGK